MPWVSRSAWGARSPSGSRNDIAPNPLGSAIHWEGPHMGTPPHGECDDIVRGIQAFHMDDRGWSDIAYSIVVCVHGYQYEGRGEGIGSAANGSTQANLDWYAICALVGEGDPQPPELISGIQDAADTARSWGAGPDVCGHRDLISTACPGDELYAQVRAGTFDPGAEQAEPEPEPITATEEGDMILIYGKSPYLLSGGKLVPVTTGDKDRAAAAGVPCWGIDAASWPTVVDAYAVSGAAYEVDIIEEGS